MNNDKVVVLAECTHARRPSTRSPVSSKCTTGAAAAADRAMLLALAAAADPLTR